MAEILCVFLWFQGDYAFKCARHKVCTGDTAQEPHCEITKLQRVEDVQKVFFQRVILIYERKADQHITIKNSSGVENLAAASVSGDRANRQSRFVLSGFTFLLININDAICRALISSVIEVEI